MGVRGGGCGLADGTEMLIEYGLILQQVGTGSMMDDAAAIQNNRVIGEAENLLGFLFDNDHRQAFVPRQTAQGTQHFIDDDRGKAFRRLVQQQQARIEHQRAADRQHLLFAARQLVAEIAAAFFQARKHLVDAGDGPRAIAGHRRHVFLDGQ